MWYAAYFAQAAPHVDSTFLLCFILALLLHLLLLLLNSLSLRLGCFLFKLEVQDLNRLFNGSVGSYVWVMRSLSQSLGNEKFISKFQEASSIRSPKEHYLSSDSRASCRRRERGRERCQFVMRTLARHGTSTALAQH